MLYTFSFAKYIINWIPYKRINLVGDPFSTRHIVASRTSPTSSTATEEARSASFFDGQSAISLVIRKQTGSNTVAVADAVRKALDGGHAAHRARRREARRPDGQLDLHRAVDPRRAVRSDVRRVPGRRHHPRVLAGSAATFISAVAIHQRRSRASRSCSRWTSRSTT